MDTPTTGYKTIAILIVNWMFIALATVLLLIILQRLWIQIDPVTALLIIVFIKVIWALLSRYVKTKDEGDT